MLEAALDRLLGAVDGLLADLDAIDGDPDLEPSNGSLAFSQASVSQVGWCAGGTLDLEDGCEDEGAQCEDDGVDSDREPDQDQLCNWQDEGDQTHLRQHPVSPSRRPSTARSPHQNVGPFLPVRVL